MKNTNNTNGTMSLVQKRKALFEVLVEGRQKYGEHCLIVNKGTEECPSWVALSRKPKGAGGVKDIDIFSHSWCRNTAS